MLRIETFENSVEIWVTRLVNVARAAETWVSVIVLTIVAFGYKTGGANDGADSVYVKDIVARLVSVTVCTCGIRLVVWLFKTMRVVVIS